MKKLTAAATLVAAAQYFTTLSQPAPGAAK